MPSARVAAPRTLAKNTADVPASVPSAPINVCVARMADAPNSASKAPDTIISNRSMSSPPRSIQASRLSLDAAEAEMAGRGIDRLGVARRRAIATAIARRTEKRAALDHLARNLDV